MNRLSRTVCVIALLGSGVAQGCDKTAEAKVQVEKLPPVTPSLPAVPTLPPPPYPTQLADQSYTVYGLRKQLRKTIETDVSVTGYIAKVYLPPECPKDPKVKCPTPPAPHMYLSDAQGEKDESKLLLVAGYAENQQAIDDAIKQSKKPKKKLTAAEQKEQDDTGILPIPVDFFVGAKVKVKGRFAYISGSGFQSSEGVLGYAGHETLEPAPEAAAAK